MPIIYLVLVGLALSFPQIGHEATAPYDSESQSTFIYENAVISNNSVHAKTNIVLPEVMKRIAKCESNDRHFDENGKVLIGKFDTSDIGRYQINRRYWEAESKKLGYDIFSESGNEAFALYLYDKYGSDPWSKSEPCWLNLN
ncbi:hypothetical protein HYT00_02385 [Candidatus Giovannonibacteria bacterium]|nr:hypothetical protein [Candidatus Giovannonibacteria bacterium]